MRILHDFKNMSANLVEPKARLCFIHIAKCGGVSINQAIRKKYLITYSRLNARASLESARIACGFDDPFADDYEAVLRFRENLLLYELEKGCGFVSGHYAFSNRAYTRHHPRYKFMTLLRDPVARFLSSYFFNSRKAEDSPWKIQESLEEYIDSDHGKRLGQDYVRFLGGVRSDGRYDSDEALVQARANLRKFDLVGVIEDTESLGRQLEKKCGLKIRIGKKNKSPVSKRDRESLVTPEIRRAIENICARDQILYKEALEISRNGAPAAAANLTEAEASLQLSRP